MIVDRLAVVGLGLIGGSVALGARKRGLAREISGWDRDPSSLEAALAAGAIDRAAGALEEACAGADLVILAVPVRAAADIARAARAAAGGGAVVTDTGSTKESIVAAMDGMAGGARFVGGHPIAGHENSGFGAARAALFDGAPFIITPTASTSPGAEDLVRLFWTGLGCRVQRLSPADHDRLFALISHLPHLVAFALVEAVFGGVGSLERVRTFTGGGFRDFTRIAASDPVMWRDVCLDNRDRIIEALDYLDGELAILREAVSTGNGGALEKYFQRARERRRAL
jgi:prephenate dehydrogenase